MAAVGAPATWVLSNHDVVRHLTRYGRAQSDGPVHTLANHSPPGPVDLALGTRRARAAVRLMLALAPPFGFSPDHAQKVPWLPQPPQWKQLTAQAQKGDERSMLELYRKALHIRRVHPALGEGSLGFRCVVNLGQEPVRLPDHREVLLSSVPLEAGLLPGDAAVWLAR
jgi:alpha-glucosidase